MQLSTGKQRFLLIILLTVLLLAGGIVAVVIYLPVFVETRLIPRLAAGAGLQTSEARVRHIGWSGIDIGPVRLEAGGQPVAAVETLRIDYSPGMLLEGRIRSITLIGLRLDVHWDEEGLRIAGVRMGREPAAGEPRAPLTPETLLPVDLDRISLQEAHIELAWRDRRLSVPLQLDLDLAKLRDDGSLQARARLTPRESALIMDAKVDIKSRRIDLTLLEATGNPGRFADLWPSGFDLKVTSEVTAGGSAILGLEPLALETATFTAQLRKTEVRAAGLTLSNPAAGQESETPIVLQAQTEGPDGWRWSCSTVELTAPVSATLAVRGQARVAKAAWSAEARLESGLAAQPLEWTSAQNLKLIEPIRLQGLLSAGSADDGGIAFQAGLASAADQEPVVAVRMADRQGRCRLQRLESLGRYTSGLLEANFSLQADGIHADWPEGGLEAAELRIDGRLAGAGEINANAEARLTGIQAKMKSTVVHMPELKATGSLARATGSQATFEAMVRMPDARLTDPQGGLTATGVELSLPLAWPPAEDQAPGGFAIKNLTWRDRPLGEVQGTLRQAGQSLQFKGRHTSKLFPGLIVNLQAEADRAGATAVFDLPVYRLEPALDLGRLTPAAQGFQAAGRLQAQGSLRMDSNGIESSGGMTVHQGRLTHSGQGLELTGISAGLRLDDLIGLRGAAGQRLSVEHLKLGSLAASGLRMDFALDSPQRLRVDHAEVQWCQGTVAVNDLMVSPQAGDIETALICSRLNPVMMLEQLGVAEGSGTGRVSGRIPLRWSKGRLTFKDAVLASPQGESGVLQLRRVGGGDLVAGLPPDTPQRTQLDIAVEALKDYTYESIVLRLENEGEVLLVQLQLDGRPNQRLPFAYDQAAGGLKRVEGRGEAEFKGIDIDLNFRSPLNEILQYKELFKYKPN